MRAEGLTLRGGRGPVYADVALDVPAGALAAVAGPPGSGRTALLLTLAGRMRPSAGTASVDGMPLPRRAAAVRRIAALGPVPGVNDLEPTLTVAEHLRERTLLRRPPRGADAALAMVGLDAEPKTRAQDLSALDAFRLALAAALLGGPRLLVADDVGDRLAAEDAAMAWKVLRGIADTGVTVLAAAADAREADTLVRLGTQAGLAK
ncbi:hypothetical protein BIV57_16415 [Mangrovactinospora gilvigrisea]|uniref:ABC transporter domain-containing protein n=1 Tax=Mangrovactinospora gilvigrisea TaxID=1428644 RepID=A0A1J7BCI1_9ACTN|nr:hypothetical protein BIV57_16415 [Mangrovactinospora gilvigrisea]